MHVAPKQSKTCQHLFLRRLNLRRFKAPVAGLCLSVGLAISGMMPLSAQGAELLSFLPDDSAATVVHHQQQSLQDSSFFALDGSLTRQGSALDRGVYLYGQVPEPGQLGIAYLVFEVSGNNVVGAFYMPHSSFDCFQGEFQANQLALQITDSYEQVTYPYSIALEHNGAIATTGTLTPTPIGLSGFYQLDTISENDHRILNVCKSDQALEI